MAGATSNSIDFSKAIVDSVPNIADWLVVMPIAICLIGGALLVMLLRNPVLQSRLATIFLAGLVYSNFQLLQHVLENNTVTMTMGRWLPPFGISFTVDIFGAVLALVSALIALLASMYAAVDVPEKGRRFGFYPFLLFMMAGVNGAFLTGDIFNLYVWFEVMLISSFGLLILGGEEKQIDGALKYAVLNLLATTFFLIATGYLYGVFGTLNMADLAIKVPLAEASAPMITIGTLFFFAFAMKAAAFPVNFWLPASYHTPGIVVSALFAGLLTKVGIYALIRTLVLVLPGMQAGLGDLIIYVAIATMLTGGLGALGQSSVPRLFGYLVIAGIGSILAGVAIGTSASLFGSIFYAIHSMITMTALYLAYGILNRMSRGADDLWQLGGAYKAAPGLSVLFLILVIAASGLPPFSGFWPKLALVEAALRGNHNLLAATILISSVLITIAMGRVWAMAFWRSGPQDVEDGSEGVQLAVIEKSQRVALYTPVIVLVALIVVIGIWPNPLFGLLQEAANGLVNPDGYIKSVFGGER